MSPENIVMIAAIVIVFGILLSVLICAVCYGFFSQERHEKHINYVEWHQFRTSAKSTPKL